MLLTREERIKVLKMARKAVSDLGVPDYPIVAGISAESTNTSVQLAQDAAEAGASFALLLPPSYWTKAISEQALHQFYRDVADESPIPLVCYNVCTETKNSIYETNFDPLSFRELHQARTLPLMIL